MKKVLILTYYWPPSGGSGVQRWMYFARHLPAFGVEPIVITVDPAYASYKFIDHSFEEKVSGLRVYRTRSREPFSFYSAVIGKPKQEAIPQGFSGEEHPGLLQKISRFIRGNFFIPDARRGWVPFAVRQADAILAKEQVPYVVTTGPPHSTHLAGLRLKKKFDFHWIADFRDPWSELYYNKQLYRSAAARSADAGLERKVLRTADTVLTVGPSLRDVLREKSGTDGAGKFQYIYNGYDADVFATLEKRKAPVFTICHLGVLSDNQPLDGFLGAVGKLTKEDGPLKLKLVGKISPGILASIHAEAPSLQLEVLEYLPHREAMQAALDADLLLNSLAAAANGKYLISGKLMEYIATGNPVLCLGDPSGDAAALLREFNDARVFSRNDEAGILEFLRRVVAGWKTGRQPQKNDATRYSRAATAGQLAALINA